MYRRSGERRRKVGGKREKRGGEKRGQKASVRKPR